MPGGNKTGPGGGGSGGGGSPQAPGANGVFTWNGAKPPGTFDVKDFGTQIAADTRTAYGQGPKINPVNPFTDYTQQTKDLIAQGLGNNDSLRSGPIMDVAGGGWLDGGNPYFEDALRRTRDNISTDVNSTFNYNGLFGSDLHAKGLSEGLANAENDARMANFENEYGRMVGARGLLDQGTATAAGYSGLLDSKAAEQTAANSIMWDRNNDSAFQHLAKYMNMLTGGGSMQGTTNQPLSFWDILGGAGSFLTGIL